MNAPYVHQHAAHCESGVAANLLRHHGAQISEPLAFGVAAALTFAWIPLVKINGLPLIAYRMPPRSILKGVARAYAADFTFETFSSPTQGQTRLDALLQAGHVVGLQTSVFWLPYFPPDMRFHFNAHNLVVYGKDGDDYLISDPVAEHPVRCASADLGRARFAKGVLAPKGLLYYPKRVQQPQLSSTTLLAAIRKNCRQMNAPIPFVGPRGMHMLAKRINRLTPQDPQSGHFLGHLVRMQEEIGTGGGGFRFLYAAFLQEAAAHTQRPALNELSEQLLTIGDHWRLLALRVARMLRGRESLDPPAIASLLHQQAQSEQAFFQQLARAAR